MHFIVHLLDHLDGQKPRKHTRQARLQTYRDLTVLQRISHLWSANTDEVDRPVDKWLSGEREKVCSPTDPTSKKLMVLFSITDSYLG